MNPTERVISFACEGEQLLAIVSEPAQARDLAARVIIVVGGPQYRVGAHRMFVKLARMLASAGHAVMRFDVRGMGDSGGMQRSFEELSVDLGAAIDAFDAQATGRGPLVLFGLCDAASASLLYVGDTRDARVSALALLNPWARTDASLAKTHLKHYYGRRLISLAFWRKLASGRVGRQALGGFMRNLRVSMASRNTTRGPAAKVRRPGEDDFFELMRAGAEGFRGPMLIALSENDLTAAEFRERTNTDAIWQRLFKRPNTRQLQLRDADHTLSASACLQHFSAELLAFLLTLPSASYGRT